MALSRLTCQYACVRERGEGTPVVALRYDVVFASDTRGRGKVDGLELTNLRVCEAFSLIFPGICEEPARPSR
jgi:hypothetical protein